MHALISIHNTVFGYVERGGTWLLPLAARFIFAATLLMYFWSSAVTKLGNGIFGWLFPSDGAYIQIFPKVVEAAGYDFSQLGFYHWLVVLAGTWAEFLLPLLVVIGLATRLSAIGMIGFVVVQSLTDIYGHGATDPKTLGAWFDKVPDSIIMDQRLFWIFTLAILVIRGAGAISVDAILRRRAEPAIA
ncbi:MAG: DoxX family protein [Pseudomonadota bacterium]